MLYLRKMAGCSIDEAFPDIATESGRVARKEERKKARRCGGPALAFLKAGGEGNPIDDLDPDRQHLTPLPPAERLEGFASDQIPSNKQWIPKKTTPAEEAEEESVANLLGQRVNDVIGQKSRSTLPKAIESSTQLPDPKKNFLGEPVPNYFGKSLESAAEGFADFSASLTDNPGYTLTQNGGPNADFLGTFAASNLNKASGVATLTTPSINDAWKPLMSNGSRSSFFEHLPFPSNQPTTSDSFNRDDKEALIKKIDTLFARLEDLESKRNENAHIEVSMFILSGLFLIYGIDSLRRI
jgi:hypothetical protein